jgi:hypothetical protein
MKNIIHILIILAIFSIWSCEKTKIEENFQTQIPSPENANVKFVNAYTSNIPVGAPGVGVTRFYVYQDGKKLNGNALATTGAWPGTATYASLPVSKTNFVMTLDRRVGNDYGKPVKGDTAFVVNSLPFNAGKYYSVFMIGQSPTQSLHLVEDKIIDPAENTFMVRFGNFVVSDLPKPLDFYSRREKRVIASAIPYKGMTDFINLPIQAIADTIDVREVGQTKNLYSTASFIAISRRSYTFYTYGRGTVTPFQERILNYTNR